MNQSILFPDLQTWDEERQVIRFLAQQSGALIECLVSTETLRQLSGAEVNDSEQALAAFASLRFDLEEMAEERIEDEAFNEEGFIVIK